MFYKIFNKNQIINEKNISPFSTLNLKRIYKEPVLITDDNKNKICWITDKQNVSGNYIDEIEL